MYNTKLVLGTNDRMAYQTLMSESKRYGASVAAKVKLIDLIASKPGSASQEYSYANNTGVDFVVMRDCMPIVAIDCDFSARTPDFEESSDAKRKLCMDAGLSIERVACKTWTQLQIKQKLIEIVETYCERRRKHRDADPPCG